MAVGRGLLVHDNEWFDALQALADNPETRQQMVLRAQTELLTNLSTPQHTQQVVDLLELAEAIKRQTSPKGGFANLRRPAMLEDGTLMAVGGGA